MLRYIYIYLFAYNPGPDLGRSIFTYVEFEDLGILSRRILNIGNPETQFPTSEEKMDEFWENNIWFDLVCLDYQSLGARAL